MPFPGDDADRNLPCGAELVGAVALGIECELVIENNVGKRLRERIDANPFTHLPVVVQALFWRESGEIPLQQHCFERAGRYFLCVGVHDSVPVSVLCRSGLCGSSHLPQSPLRYWAKLCKMSNAQSICALLS